ncbi:AraC family transcriptional regulator [Providencia stuartii]|uniref:HTH-type transcriptional activator AarP n=1 Tax=Providencia stuartii TaxID=588 RepID=UPI000B4DEFB1|nr:HTH-type transcriptional activator AarP [Providencia stuartii]MBN5561482.1 HTH-type transcriptional activator AarP [Providencia stuartii]PNL57713.1 AraC family transcriptional regulator [Providencia stuartii]RMA14034.1 helix-turn-helix domain-containing protein [Providencia stuartii]SUC45183.1 right oriC-binding transcriptional activator [Providencia stuartii]
MYNKLPISYSRKHTQFQSSIISEILVWIEGNLTNRLSLDDIAQHSGYTKWHLQRVFRKIVGMPLGEYIRRRRICEAAKELQTTNLQVIDIALKYQFNSQQSFAKRFKAYLGISPSLYRLSDTGYNDLLLLEPKVA